MLIVVVVFFYTEDFTEKREIHEETEKWCVVEEGPRAEC